MPQEQSAQHELKAVINAAYDLITLLDKALVNEQELPAAPPAFQAQVRDSAVSALHSAQEALPIVLKQLQDCPALIEQISKNLSAQEYATATPSGITYDSPIPKEELSTRAFNCLSASNITTIREVCGLDYRNIMMLRNFGIKSLREVEAYRERLGVPMTK